MNLIIYLFFLNLFIKVYNIIQDKKIFDIYFMMELLEVNNNVGFENLVDSFMDY